MRSNSDHGTRRVSNASTESVQAKQASQQHDSDGMGKMSWAEQVQFVRPPAPVCLSGSTPGSGLQAAGGRLDGGDASNASPVQTVSALSSDGGAEDGAIQQAAAVGITGTSRSMPHASTIQRSFGDHDISNVQAYTGTEATQACTAMGASAYTQGSKVVFGDTPSLHTAAHEAAHVVQQRSGQVQLSGGVGRVGDRYEHHAEAVARTVESGKSAESLLCQFETASSTAEPDVQKMEGNARPNSESVEVQVPNHRVHAPVQSSPIQLAKAGVSGSAKVNTSGDNASITLAVTPAIKDIKCGKYLLLDVMGKVSGTLKAEPSNGTASEGVDYDILSQSLGINIGQSVFENKNGESGFSVEDISLEIGADGDSAGGGIKVKFANGMVANGSVKFFRKGLGGEKSMLERLDAEPITLEADVKAEQVSFSEVYGNLRLKGTLETTSALVLKPDKKELLVELLRRHAPKILQSVGLSSVGRIAELFTGLSGAIITAGYQTIRYNLINIKEGIALQQLSSMYNAATLGFASGVAVALDRAGRGGDPKWFAEGMVNMLSQFDSAAIQALQDPVVQCAGLNMTMAIDEVKKRVQAAWANIDIITFTRLNLGSIVGVHFYWAFRDANPDFVRRDKDCRQLRTACGISDAGGPPARP